MSFPFSKLVGAGNDFIFIEEKALPSGQDILLFVRLLCHRQFGIGADGLVVVKNVQVDDIARFEWDFFNNDGSFAEMCGNAARCAVVYIKDLTGKTKCEFKTAIGMISGEMTDKGSRVSWKINSMSPQKKSITLGYGKSFEGWFIDTGVPHFVVLDQPQGSVNGRDCLNLQTHESFGKKQTNVTLLSNADNKNWTKTFERGVRDFTLACGTGVIASAVVLKELTSQKEHQLTAPGGPLSVTLQDDKTVSLEGPAKLVFKGVYQ